MVADATGRITRPRQIYTGELRRKFIPVYERQLSGRISGQCLDPLSVCLRSLSWAVQGAPCPCFD